MEAIHWRLIIDFGLCILIWIVQLIIYPGFQKYGPQALQAWHSQYSRRIGIIVIPLMLVQLFLYIGYIIREPNAYSISGTFLIAIVWLITFLYFAPAHQRISSGETGHVVRQLTQVNWWRTIIWSLVFVLGLYEVLDI